MNYNLYLQAITAVCICIIPPRREYTLLIYISGKGPKASIPLMFYASPNSPEGALSGAKINIFFEITNIFQEKLRFMLKKVISGGEGGT